jgi:hypothetical protein
MRAQVEQPIHLRQGAIEPIGERRLADGLGAHRLIQCDLG